MLITKEEIFKNFQAVTVTNHFNPPQLDSTYKHPWWKSWLLKDGKVPNETSQACRGLYPWRNVVDLVYSNKLKQNHKNIHKNLTITLATDEKSSGKIANPKYDPIDIEIN